MSARPDPAADFVGALRWIMDRLDALDRQEDARRLNATQAAKALGFGESYLRGHPWRVPGFGLSGTLHSLADWRDWLSRPEAERRAEWDAMPLRARRHARGAA